MYITINGAAYAAARRWKTANSVTYAADTLPELVAEGGIGVCRDDGFLLLEDDSANYARQISRPGTLTLTNAAEEPVTQLDRVEAQATYTAMMTDTLLPEEDEDE